MCLTTRTYSFIAAAIGLSLIALSGLALVYALVGAHYLAVQIMGERDAP